MQYKLSSILFKKTLRQFGPFRQFGPIRQSCTVWNSVKRHYEIILEGSGTFHEANLCKLEYVDTAYVTCIKMDNMIYVKRIYYLSSKQQFSLCITYHTVYFICLLPTLA